MEADITLEQFKDGEIESPGIIASGALGPCIAIGIFDKSKRFGYMIHEPNAFHHNNVSIFLEGVIRKSRKRNLLIAVAGGGMDPNEEDEDEVMACRDFVKRELTTRFNDNQMSFSWNNSIDSIELYLDTQTGEFFIEKWKDNSDPPDITLVEFNS